MNTDPIGAEEEAMIDQKTGFSDSHYQCRWCGAEVGGSSVGCQCEGAKRQRAEPIGHVGRTPEGKFAKGNKLAPGRTEYQKRTATLMQLAQTAVTDQDFIDVLKAMLKLAKEGDERAAQFIQNARFGKLRETIQVEQTTPLFGRVEAVMEAIEAEDEQCLVTQSRERLGLSAIPGVPNESAPPLQSGPTDDAGDREIELRGGLQLPLPPAGD